MKSLSLKQKRFALEYLLNNGNASKAARVAGYSARTARQQGQHLLTNVAILELVGQHLAKADLTAPRTLEELRRAAFFDIRELFDARGHLKNIKTLPAEVASALASAEVVRTNMISGDGKREWLHLR